MKFYKAEMKNLESEAGVPWNCVFCLEPEPFFCLEPESPRGPRTSGAAQINGVSVTLLKTGLKQFHEIYIFAKRLDCKVRNSCSQYLYKHKILDLIQEMRDRRQEARDMIQET